MMVTLSCWFRFLFLLALASAFTTPLPGMRSPMLAMPISYKSPYQMSTTTVAPPSTDTEKVTRRRNRDNDKDSYDEDYIRKNGPLEYLEDDSEQSRDMNDPFHILLLAETFRNPKVTINYVSGSLQFVLNMPYEDSVDAALFAKEQGMSCVGTWTREECLKLGKALQQRDLCVRVVPFVPGGQRAWQANKDASAANGSNGRQAGGGGDGGDYIDADYYYD